MDPYWTVCRTHANSEKIAMRNLQNQGFEYFCPKIWERKLVSKKGYVLKEVPLFPCYLFVKIDTKWSCLRSTHGISSVLTVNGLAPAKVADSVIESLKARQDERGYITLPKAKSYSRGERVTITSGTLAGQQALVERMPAKERQKVLLALLANKISVLVSETDFQVS